MGREKAKSKETLLDSVLEHKSRYFLGIFFLLVVDLINVLLPLTVKEGIDSIASTSLKRLLVVIAVYFVLTLIQSLGRYLWRIYLMGAAYEITHQLRKKFYQHNQNISLDYQGKLRSGDLMSRAVNDVDAVRMALGPGVLITADVILLFSFLIPAMFYLSWKLTLLSLVCLPLIPVLTAFIGNRIDFHFTLLQEKLALMSNFIQERLVGIRLVKSLRLQQSGSIRLAKASRDYYRQGKKLGLYQAGFYPLLSFFNNLGVLLILFYGGRDVMSGALSLGAFVAFQRFMYQLSWPMEAIGFAITMNREGIAAYRRIQAVLALPEQESVRPAPPPSQLIQSEGLMVDYIHFGFTESQFEMELKNLQVNPGQKIGIVGSVGSGKTTFFRVLLRQYDNVEASLFWKGKSLYSIPLTQLRRDMVFVEQQSVLFSESIEGNLFLGLEKDSVDDSEVSKALHDVQIYDEVAQFKEGKFSVLGERGVNLSGGQKQRITLARALIRKPKVLLLDDCLSAVDVSVENKILSQWFEKDHGDMAILFATHRLSVMPRMDDIWVFDKGKIVAKGTHEKLLQTEPVYQQLWQKNKAELSK